jgi:serine/threonine-protein kinase RsbW
MSDFWVHAELADEPIATAVLGRVVGLLGARVALPIERLSDALLLSDAVIAAGRGTPHLLQVDAAPKRLALRVGPLGPGGAERMIGSIEAPLGRGALARLVDQVETAPADGGEFLVLALSSS